MTLDELRTRLNGVDRRLLELVAERQSLSREVAEAKRSTGYPTRDFRREREVILGARERATQLGVSPDVAESLMRLLIRTSLTTQEQASVNAQTTGNGRRALLIGGAGRMGGWFAGFLASQGFAVEIADPAASADSCQVVADWRTLALTHELIVVATPLAVTNTILLELARRRPSGVVFDVGSLKSPLREGLSALRAAGVRATSLHPMFGPDTSLLSGRHVIFIDLGAGDALEQARALFAPTMVEQVTMGLEEHDRLIAHVLGISHALNIAFVTALAGSGETAPRLVQMSSTTFDAQFDVASEVVKENPELYFEIQRLNDYGGESLAALARAIEQLRAAVSANDAGAFAALMRRGLEYTQSRQPLRERRA